MKALILAAGLGKRLKYNKPKILIKISNKTLLERHYENLFKYGVKKIGIVIGYKNTELKKFIKKIDKHKIIKIFINKQYKLGSIVSLVKAHSFFKEKNEIILMDGDVLYDKKILKKLIFSKKKNCLLIDKNYEIGEEPVKVCIKNKKICDFGKLTTEKFDYCGESIGFFKFSHLDSLKFISEAKKIMKKDKNEMYEEAIRKIITNKIFKIEFENILKLPWTEIDFKKDLISAKKIINNINE